MSSHKSVAGGVLATLLLSNVAAAPAPTGSIVIAQAYGRNDSLQHYTFHMGVAMAMRHFPWLHFRLDGDGSYQRDRRYVVHFTGGPPFIASKLHDIDLSMIDPTMWPGRYRYVEAGQQDGNTIFSLEPVDGSTLQNASVALNSDTGAQWVDVTYTDGTHIHMNVTSDDRLGYLLPEKIEATVDYPHVPMSADARFSDYSIAR